MPYLKTYGLVLAYGNGGYCIRKKGDAMGHAIELPRVGYMLLMCASTGAASVLVWNYPLPDSMNRLFNAFNRLREP